MLLDYVDIMTRLPKLLEQVVAENEEAETMIDGAQAATIDELAKRIPKIIGLLPDIFLRSRSTDDRHPAAVEEMTKDLLKLAERANPDLLVSMESFFFIDVPSLIRFFFTSCSLKFNVPPWACWMEQLKSTLCEEWDTRDSYRALVLNRIVFIIIFLSAPVFILILVEKTHFFYSFLHVPVAQAHW